MITGEPENVVLALACPYCNHTNRLHSDPHHNGIAPRQIEITPYTRTKGERETDKSWKQVGRDFFAKLANWEAIGILRVPENDTKLDISYQLIQCEACGHFFDVYLNWTPDGDFEELWPHLFGRDEQQQIQRYNRVPRTFGMLNKLAEILPSFLVATILAVALLFIVSFIPRLVIAYDQAPGAVLQEFWQLSAIAFFTRLTGGIVLVALLYYSHTYLQEMHTTGDFYNLFDVQKRDHVTHWLNFTVSRVTGVQQKEHGYSITQTSVLAGYPSATILLATWLIAHLNSAPGSLSTLENLGLLVALILAGYLVGVWFEYRNGAMRRVLSKDLIKEHNTFFDRRTPVSRAARRAVHVLDWLVPVTGARLRGAIVWGLGTWLAIAVAQLINAQPGEWEWVIDGLFEVLFWMVVAYYVGTHMQLAFVMAIYVLYQVSHIPLKVHPLLGFDELQPVKRLVHISTMILAAVLLLVLLLTVLEVLPWEQIGIPLPPHQMLENTTWLFDWATIGLLLMFFVLGLIISRWIPLGVVVYIVLLLLSNALTDTLPLCATAGAAEVCQKVRPVLGVSIIKIPVGGSEITLWPSLILVGAFIYLVGFVYIETIQQQFVKLQNMAKQPYLKRLNQRIVELSHNLLEDPATCKDSGILELVRIRDYLQEQETDSSLSRLVANTMIAGFLFFLPAVLELVGQSLGISL